MRVVPASTMFLRARRGFTMMELAIIAVIVATIAAVAMPRIATAAGNARASALLADARTLHEAIGRYKIEHSGLSPAHLPDGTVDTTPGQFKNRLLKRTTGTGVIDSAGQFGPYLRSMPINRLNGLDSIRTGGAVAGSGSAGWWFDASTGDLLADDSPESAAATKDMKKTAQLMEKAMRR